jgi:hypothetical protein
MHQAVRAASIRVAKPGDANPFAHLQVFNSGTDGIYPADNFMSGNHRQLRIGEFAVDDVQIRATNPAGENLYANFVRAG